MSEEELPLILCLPDECLRHVLQFVDISDRFHVSLVCQRFYEGICELEKYKHPIEITYDQISDDDIFRSITASKRKFCNLKLDLKGCRVVSSLSRIEKVVATFGDRIKQFKIWSSDQGECTELTDNHLIALLKLIPRVEEIFLQTVMISTSDESRVSLQESDLRWLNKLLLDHGRFDSSFVLDSIPQDNLTELVFTFDCSDKKLTQNFFNRQSNIKKLEIFENGYINFDHLQLEHLKMNSSHNYVSVISNQPNLRFLDLAQSSYHVDDDVFLAVCQLKHLEVFRTCVDVVSLKAFKSLRKLSELKELRIDSHKPHHRHLIELSKIKSFHHLKKLTVLQLGKICDLIIIEMGQNFKSLRNIELIHPTIKTLGIAVQSFPSLHSIHLDYTAFDPEDILEIRDDFSHESLKHLEITHIIDFSQHSENTKSLLKLVNACPNLEKIMLSELKKFSTSDLNEIFNNHKKLSHLSLGLDEFKIDEETINIIKTSGRKLDYLRLDGLYNFQADDVKVVFEMDFPTIIVKEQYPKTLIMKKRGIINRDFVGVFFHS